VVVAVVDDLGDDGGVPRPAGRGDPAGDVGAEDRGQDEPLPPQPFGHPEAGHRFTQVAGDRGGAGDDVEQDVPLRAQRHQQDPAHVQGDPEVDERGGGEREQKVRREAGQDLDDGLGDAGHFRVHADPHADRHPHHRGQRDQDNHPGEGHRAEGERMRERPDPDRALHIGQGAPDTVHGHDGDGAGEEHVPGPLPHDRSGQGVFGQPERAGHPIQGAADRAQRAAHRVWDGGAAQQVEHDAALLLGRR
jgi:hypothetical protein